MNFLKNLIALFFAAVLMVACSGGGGGDGSGSSDSGTEAGATADWPTLFAAYQNIKAGTTIDQVTQALGYAPNLPINDFGNGKGTVRWKAKLSNAILSMTYDQSGGAESKGYVGPNGAFGENLY
jgi:hypothetical protein